MNSTWQRRIWFLRPTLVTIVCYALAMVIAYQWNRPVSRPSAARSQPAPEEWASWTELRHPEERLTPTDVVRLQLIALTDKDRSRGVLQCFAFASPGNRLVTGPLARFAKMVSRPPYDLLVNADATVIGRTVEEEDNTARIFVAALRDQELETFVWILTRQSKPPYTGCWMTDSVLLVDPQVEPRGELQRREHET